MIRFIYFLFQLFKNAQSQNKPSRPNPPSKPLIKSIDWTDPGQEISKYFTVKNAIYLPRWKRLANDQDSLDQNAKDALEKFFKECMDPIREIIGKPLTVHVAFRSPEYNVLIGGAKMSIHMARKYADGSLVAACDFSADLGKGSVGANCDEIKAILLPHLERLNIRLEDNGKGATWIHVDNRKPGPGGRFFKP